MSEINPGDVVRVSTDPGFRDGDGALGDPDVVRLRWQAHSDDGETVWVYGTDAEITRDSIGLYHADIPVTVAGMHHFRWEGEGLIVAAEEGSFRSVTKFG